MHATCFANPSCSAVRHDAFLSHLGMDLWNDAWVLERRRTLPNIQFPCHILLASLPKLQFNLPAIMCGFHHCSQSVAASEQMVIMHVQHLVCDLVS